MKNTLYLLAGLSTADFDWWLRSGKPQKLTAGSVLIYENQPINALYLVLDGVLSVQSEAAGHQVIAELSQGDIVGEISFIDTRPPSATVKAVTEAIVWTIPRVELLRKIASDRDFAAHFYESIAIFLADRLRHTVGRLNYEKVTDASSTEAADDGKINPAVEETLAIAQSRLEWMLNHLSRQT